MVRARRVWRLVPLVLALSGATPAVGIEGFDEAPDLMLAGDPIDPETDRAAVIVPGAPWIRPGEDGVFGTADDRIDREIRGDTDLVVRVGAVPQGSPVGPPSAAGGMLLRGVIEPFGGGMPIDFSVVPTDDDGRPVEPPYLEGLPFLVLAFGDLDGDGWIGITRLDGDDSDASVEATELRPLGTRYAIASGGLARGKLAVVAGGPPGAPLRVALAAVAYAGWTDPEFLGGVVPDGPAVMTRLPFLPLTNAADILTPFPLPYGSADPDGRVAIRALPAFLPDPADERIGESFTLPVDGSEPTLDLAEVSSGHTVRFGAVRPIDPQRYVPLQTSLLRPGLDDDGQRITVEPLLRLAVADDGPESTTTLRVVPLDSLGNVSSIDEPGKVKLKTGGSVRILSPDRDGKPYREEIEVADARGVAIVLDDGGDAFDDLSRDRLVLKWRESLTRVDLALPDPDVDDDGLVTYLDEAAVGTAVGTEFGEPGYEAAFDLDGDGRIDAADITTVRSHLGRPVARDLYERDQRGDCAGKVVRAVFRYTGGACAATTNAQDGKLECDGDPDAGAVEVVVVKHPDKHRIEPSALVDFGGSFAVSHEKGKLASDLALELRGPRGIQSLKLHASCSRRLSVHDQFGALRLIELETTEGGIVTETPVSGSDPTESRRELRPARSAD